MPKLIFIIFIHKQDDDLTCKEDNAMFTQVLLVLDKTMAGQVQASSFTQVQPAIKSWRQLQATFHTHWLECVFSF